MLKLSFMEKLIHRALATANPLFLGKFHVKIHVTWWCHDIEKLPTLKALFNTLRPRQNGRRFADDTFKCIFLNENVRISIKISLKFVPKGPINNNPALVQIMAWRRSGDKPLSEPRMVCFLTHICVTRPQWVNGNPTITSEFPSKRPVR